ncbi:MAG: DUF2117 domain-containing protein [Euryarchaeota archaeon]|nr:MAG: hypothetical protein C5S47_08335 [ANME-2 cluster archaeon]MEA1864822.1 DUF2117 domain-containing protein [Euryarchaeota archaeon]
MKPEIGIVIHGPEIIDSGGAHHVLDVLSEHYAVTAVLGGTMGRAAVLDAFLEDRIDISRNVRPSEAIDSLSWTDVVILLNRGKSLDSGIEFGKVVTARAKEIPIVQIEDPMEGGVAIPWNDAIYWAESIGDLLGLPVWLPPRPEAARLVHTTPETPELTRRRISNVLLGETIRIGGIVVGTAISENIEIIADCGRIVEIAGARMKEHGIEKIGRIDLTVAIIRTGSIRRTQHTPRIGAIEEKSGGMRVVLIDHNAEAAFELASGADLAITVGDDTTAIAGDILYRLGIPIIGITDMDSDHVLSDASILPGSVVLQLEPGNDDLVGNAVRELIFDGENYVNVASQSIESIRAQVIEIAGTRLIDVVRW